MPLKRLFAGSLIGVFLCTAFLVLPCPALCATYYVDPASGNDGNPGTSQSAPWAHIPGDPSGGNFPTRINGGDTIYIKSGSVFNLTGKLLIDGSHYSGGSASAPITIARLSTWGSGNVVFNGSGASLGQWGALVQVTRVDYITLDGAGPQGFDIRNSTNRGFEADGQSESNLMAGLAVKNMRVLGSASYSFYLHSQRSFLVENVECDGNSRQNNGGFYTGDNGYGCSQGIYRNCVAHHIGNSPGSQAGGTDLNIGFWTTNSYNIAFVNCSAHAITGKAFDTGTVSASGGLPSQMADNILFLNCTATRSFAGFGASLDDIAKAADNRTQGRQYYVNCLSYNNYSNGAWVYAGVTAYFYNCLFALNPQVGIYSFSYVNENSRPTRPVSMYFANTIFYQNNTSGATGQGSCDLMIGTPSINGNPTAQMYYGDYNLFDRGSGLESLIAYDYLAPLPPGVTTRYFYYSVSTPNFTTWKSFSGCDANSGDSVIKGWHARFTNPGGYVFTLGSGSSAIGRGSNLASTRPTWAPDDVFAIMRNVWGIQAVDFNNNPRPATGNWDMGPYNYGSAAACTYTISPTSQSFSASAGSGRVNVTTQSGCAWTATSGASWMSIRSGVSGRGSGTVSYSISANSGGSARTAAATIASQVFTVTQAGRAYTVTASASSGGTISPSGRVTAPVGSSLTFSISPNAGRSIRRVTVDGRFVGAVGSYTFSNISSNHWISAQFR